MTSSVTERMGKVRHNSLNQSDYPPPSGPLAPTIMPLYVAALHSRVHTQRDQSILHFLRWAKREAGEALHHIQCSTNANYIRLRVCLANNLAVCICPYVFPSRPRHMIAAASLLPFLNQHPSLLQVRGHTKWHSSWSESKRALHKAGGPKRETEQGRKHKGARMQQSSAGKNEQRGAFGSAHVSILVCSEMDH